MSDFEPSIPGSDAEWFIEKANLLADEALRTDDSELYEQGLADHRRGHDLLFTEALGIDPPNEGESLREMIIRLAEDKKEK